MLVYPSSIDLCSRTLRFLTGQLTDLQAKVEASEEALIAYTRANSIVVLDEKTDRNAATDKLALAKKLIKLDVLVQCAGRAERWQEYELPVFREVMEVNLNGLFICCREVVPHMRNGLVNLKVARSSSALKPTVEASLRTPSCLSSYPRKDVEPDTRFTHWYQHQRGLRCGTRGRIAICHERSIGGFRSRLRRRRRPVDVHVEQQPAYRRRWNPVADGAAFEEERTFESAGRYRDVDDEFQPGTDARQ